jgi:uncharacterized protein YlxW (UPF0749 family)
VDGKLVESPYEIDVIGDPTTLRSGMVFLRGPVEQLQGDGAEVDITEFSSLDISAVRNPVRPEFAQPDE